MPNRRSPPPRTRSQQREATRERIVEAALEAFAEKGFHGASTRDIALRAGTHQGLITYHFPSTPT
jgi:AcrR family transcriptional regulator